MHTLVGDYARYNHPKYYPVWRACEERQMVVHNHSGPAPDQDFELPGAMGIFLVEFAWWAARPMWHMIFGGVFEEFPRLNYCLTEVSEFGRYARGVWIMRFTDDDEITSVSTMAPSSTQDLARVADPDSPRSAAQPTLDLPSANGHATNGAGPPLAEEEEDEDVEEDVEEDEDVEEPEDEEEGEE